jgi:hypothetical protein
MAPEDSGVPSISRNDWMKTGPAEPANSHDVAHQLPSQSQQPNANTPIATSLTNDNTCTLFAPALSTNSPCFKASIPTGHYRTG